MATSRPNVVLFVSDRQHADTIGAGGTAGIATPHLDRLASDGVLFHRAYTTSPICSPARMALLSGRYPHDNGMVANHQQRPGPDRLHYPRGVTNLAEYLGADEAERARLRAAGALEDVPTMPAPTWS